MKLYLKSLFAALALTLPVLVSPVSASATEANSLVTSSATPQYENAQPANFTAEVSMDKRITGLLMEDEHHPLLSKPTFWPDFAKMFGNISGS